MKNVYSDLLISGPGTRLHGNTLTVEVRLPWYRALPLSVAQIGEVSVDGKVMSLDGAELELNGKRFPLSAAAEQTQEFWFVLDSAFVHLPSTALDSQQPHHIELLLKLFPPYIPMLVWTTRGTTTLTAN